MTSPVNRAHKHVPLMLDRVGTYTRAIFDGISSFAAQHGPWRFSLLYATANHLAEALRRKEADGVIVCATSPEYAAALRRLDLPAVNIAHEPTTASVSLDDAEVGRVGARYLLASDVPNFGFIDIPQSWYSPLRCQGFREAVEHAGRASAVYTGPSELTGTMPEGAMPGLEQWLRQLPKPVGVMACDDVHARQAARVCRGAGLRVPQDVALVGAGNDAFTCEMADPPLTSIAIAADRVGFEAARLLARLMEHRGPPREIPKPVLIAPVGIVARLSTPSHPTEDPDLAEALRFIRDTVHLGIGVEDVLEVVAMSRRTLEMRFRSALGRSPAEEIRRVRIDHAKHLLVETDGTMAGIARAAGFSSPNQFCETFRRETGVSPTEFRSQYRAG